MSTIAIRLRTRRDIYAGFFLVVLGPIMVLLAVVGSSASALMLGLVGIAISLIGLIVAGQSSNRSVLRINPNQIEWDKGFWWRWFGVNPVQYATVSAALVSSRRKSILLAREGKRPPFVLIRPVTSDFPQAVEALRERMSRANWVTSDLPLIQLVAPR